MSGPAYPTAEFQQRLDRFLLSLAYRYLRRRHGDRPWLADLRRQPQRRRPLPTERQRDLTQRTKRQLLLDRHRRQRKCRLRVGPGEQNRRLVQFDSGLVRAGRSGGFRGHAPASGPAGGGVLVNWTVANLGAGDTAVTSWQDNVYADTGSTLTSNGILLASYTHNGLLAAGASYSESQDVPLPISLSGPCNLFVVTNEPFLAPGETTTPPPPVYESNFNNDTSAPMPIGVVQTLANLENHERLRADLRASGRQL